MRRAQGRRRRLLRGGLALIPAVFGTAGTELGDAERRLFREADPLGFILFARNVGDPEGVRRLVAELRESVGRRAPVLVDQEGGRVQRLGPPHWPAWPPAAAYGRLARDDPARAEEAARTGHFLMGRELAALGIDVDCAPVLDLAVPGADPVIGDRAFAADPATVARLGRAACEGLGAAGVLPVIKHVPGHGRADADSHHALPVVTADREELSGSDFAPFRALADMPVAMTAHVVYQAFDGARPLTVSPAGIRDAVRGEVGFDGFLLSDDLSMKALDGTLEARAAASLGAGCDAVLHCNGERAEMERIAADLPPPTAAATARWERAAAWVDERRLPPETPVPGREAFEEALARA